MPKGVGVLIVKRIQNATLKMSVLLSLPFRFLGEFLHEVPRGLKSSEALFWAGPRRTDPASIQEGDSCGVCGAQPAIVDQQPP